MNGTNAGRRLTYRDIPWMLFLAALVLWATAPMVIQDKIDAYSDNLLINIPRYVFLHKEYTHGRIPVWEPEIMAGAPAETFFTPSNPYYLLSLPQYLWKDPIRSFQVSIMMSLLLVAFGFYLFARLGLGGSCAASAAGAAVYLLNGFTMSQLEHAHYLPAFGWAPLVLLGAVNWLRTRRAFWAFSLAFATAMQWYAFIFFFSAMTLLVLVIMFLFWNKLRGPDEPRLDARAVLGAASGIALGCAAAAIVIIPFFLQTRGMARTHWHLRTWIDGTLGPASLPGYVFPGIFGSYLNKTNWTNGAYWHEASGFMGFALLVLVFYYGRKRFGRMGWFFALTALSGLILTFGARTPLGIIYFNLPVFNMFEYPGRSLFFWSLGMAGATVYAIRAAEAHEARGGWFARIAAAAALLFGAAWLFFGGAARGVCLRLFRMLYEGRFTDRLADMLLGGRAGHDWPFYAEKFDALIYPSVSVALTAASLTLAAALLLGLAGGRLKRAAPLLWIALICASLGHVVPMLALYVPADFLRKPPEYSAWVAKNLHGSRLLPATGAVWDPIWPYNMETDTIYGIPVSKGYLHFHPLLDPAMPQWTSECRYYATKYITNYVEQKGPERDCARGALVATFPQNPMYPGEKPVEIYKVAGVLPPAYLAPDFIVAGDAWLVRPIIKGRGFDPREFAVIDRTEGVGAAGIRHGRQRDATDRALMSRPRPDTVLVKTRSAQPRILVVLDTYFEGWRATVDDRPAPILRAFGGFKAVPLARGEHTVRMTYRPTALLKCLPATLLAWAAIFAGLALSYRKKRGAA